jgi:hypothetical protein
MNQSLRCGAMSAAVALTLSSLGALDVRAQSTYQLTSSPVTWLQAESEAVAVGGHLVTINDASEQELLMQLFGSVEDYWIGFTDQAVEGTWVWSSGEPVTYTNWALGEPNNSNDEDFAVMNWTPTAQVGNWNDLPNSGFSFASRGIIEIPVPEPTCCALGALGICGLCVIRRRRTMQKSKRDVVARVHA